MSNGGTWDPISLPIRPGLYLNFVEKALAAITGGPRGVVGVPLFSYGDAEPGKFYTIENEKQATDAFGAEFNDVPLLILQGGAKEVLVYTMPAFDADDSLAAETAFVNMRDAFAARPFNIFVYPEAVSATEQDNTLTWMKGHRTEGKHFHTVFGGTAEEDRDSTIGNARSIRLSDDYAINLIIGGIVGSGEELPSGEYAAYIAGLIAGTPINRSITYQALPLVDVNNRLTNSQIKTALTSGSLVLVNDGRYVRVEQGIVTKSDETARGKIRIMRARQAVATDIPKTACDHYIGKVDNNPAGQAALIAAIRAYLETLELNNVLMAPVVKLDPQRPSVGDSVFLVISYVEVDSMERIFLTINV